MDANNPYSSTQKPWAIFRLLSIKHKICIARFRLRADAKTYKQIFTRLEPQARFEVVFDPHNNVSQT